MWSWTWAVVWLIAAVGVSTWAWLHSAVDLSYTFVVATAGVREVLVGIDRRSTAREILSWAIGFPAALWSVGIAVEQMTGWGWTDRASGAAGVALAAVIAFGAVLTRSMRGTRSE